VKHRSLFWFQRVAWACIFTLTLWVVNAWAGDGFEFTRETYDLIMKWVNFLILAALIIKYARRPIANFLDNQKRAVATSISHLESQKQAAQEKLAEYQRQLTASQERLEEIQKRIVAEGEERKAQLIADAENDSRIMLDVTQLRIDHMLRETHSRIISELVDAAAQMALTQLPGLVTAEDQERMINMWLQAAQS
jgi:F-type H+-transporting ATPase subunit b